MACPGCYPHLWLAEDEGFCLASCPPSTLHSVVLRCTGNVGNNKGLPLFLRITILTSIIEGVLLLTSPLLSGQVNNKCWLAYSLVCAIDLIYLIHHHEAGHVRALCQPQLHDRPLLLGMPSLYVPLPLDGCGFLHIWRGQGNRLARSLRTCVENPAPQRVCSQVIKQTLCIPLTLCAQANKLAFCSRACR